LHSLQLVPSGIPAIGDIPWGSHFCNFYEKAEDLADSLVPFFKAGLEHGEQCLWVTSEPFGVEDAKAALRNAVPQLERHIQQGHIDIIDHRDWYLRSGKTKAEEVLQEWVTAKERALANGRTGLRLTGNTYWLEAQDWKDFADYETAWGQKASAEAGAEAVLLTWSDTPITASVTADPLHLAAAGTHVGDVTFTAGVRTITVPLVLSSALTDPGPGWRLTHPGELF